MPELRHLRVHPLSDGIGRQPHSFARNRIHGVLCDGCRWEQRCRKDRLCWAREKADQSAERAARARVWTRAAMVDAVHRHVRVHGRVPTWADWATESEEHPLESQVRAVWGGKPWEAMLGAAGLKPLGPWGKDPNDYSGLGIIP